MIGKPAASCDARAGDLADDLDGGLAQPNLGARPTRASRLPVDMPGLNPTFHARLSARQLRKSAPGAGLARRRGCIGGVWRRSHRRSISSSRRRVEVESECGLRVAGPEPTHRYDK